EREGCILTNSGLTPHYALNDLTLEQRRTRVMTSRPCSRAPGTAAPAPAPCPALLAERPCLPDRPAPAQSSLQSCASPPRACRAWSGPACRCGFPTGRGAPAYRTE